MRITQTMMARQYTKRVSSVINDYAYVNKQVGTGRKFFRGSENPAGAAKAYYLRRQASQCDDYVSNVKEVQYSLETKSSTLTQVSKSLEDAYNSLLGVMNGPKNTPEDKAIVANQFRSIQETIVKDMNTKYGDQFLFGGSNKTDTPFELKSGVLTYLGVDVSGKSDYVYPDGHPLEGQVVQGSDNGSDDVLNLLKDLAGDKLYTDLGFGLTFNNGKVAESSAYNSAFPGINVLGYGTSPAGYSNNIVLLLGQMADELDGNCDPSVLDNYLTKFKEQKQNVLNETTKLGSDTMFLEYTQTRLEDMQDNIDNKVSDTEYIDSEEAIMNLNIIDYMYQALLKTSQNILSNSFIDFMN